MKKIILLLLILAGFITKNYSQFKITGTISDSKTHQTLPNASIFIPELNIGVISDLNGNYTLENIPNGKYDVKFSYIGYFDLIKNLSEKNNILQLNISLNPKSPICLNQVVITAGTYSTQDETAIKIETINKKDIEGFGGISLIKDLSRIPGIDAVSKGNGIATPIIRGLSTSNILVLNNGVKMQNFQFSVNHPYLIDEFGVERIEVVKGPASLLFGSNAVGGALNMIKESPAPKSTIKTDVNMNYNSNTQGLVTNVGVKSTPGNYFFGLRAGIKSHKDYIDGNGKIVPNSRFNAKSFKIFTGFNAKNLVSKLFVDYNLMKLGLSVPPAFKLFSGNDRTNNYWYQDLSNILISTKNVLYLGKIRNELNINYQTNNRKLFETPDISEEFKTVDMLLNTWTYELKTSKPFGDHKMIFAFQGLNQNNKNSNAPEHVLPDFSIYDLAGMGLVQLNFMKKLHTQIGIRYDFRHINIKKQEHVHQDINKNFQNLSFSMGLTGILSHKVLIRSNIASGFRTPSIAELSQEGGHGARYELGNPNLAPQRNIEGDLSLHIHNTKTVLEFSGFYNYINKYIYLSPTDETSIHGLPVFKYLQDNAKLYGFETNFGFFPASWMNFSFAYNYLVAKKNNDSYLPLIPQNKLRGNISFSKSFDKKQLKDFSFEIESIYAFVKNNHHIAESNTPAYNIYNLSAVQTLAFNRQKIKISAKINNLFNTTYIDHISTLKGLGYYEIGRNINIGIKIILDKH